MGAHARLAPSAAYIWSKCPGMPAAVAGIPGRDSDAARRGTAAHEVLEECLRAERVGSKGYVGTTRDNGVIFNADDSAAVDEALNYLWTEVEPGDEWGPEEKLTYSDDVWGTCDFFRYRPKTQELLIVDYKHGSGVAVEAQDNPQGFIYGQMKVKALGNRGVSRVRFVIVQPRCFHEQGPIREWVIDAFDMLDLEDRLQDAIARTKAPDAPLVPGDHCRWCDAAAVCPALRQKAVDALDHDFGPIDAEGKANLEGAALAKALGEALPLAAQVEAWAKAVRELAYAEAERGLAIPGHKLVAKRATRRWKDDASKQAMLFSLDLYGLGEEQTHEPAVVKSVAQIEAVVAPLMPGKTKKAQKAQAADLLAQWVSKESSGHSLVPDSDDRPPLRPGVTEDFAAVVE